MSEQTTSTPDATHTSIDDTIDAIPGLNEHVDEKKARQSAEILEGIRRGVETRVQSLDADMSALGLMFEQSDKELRFLEVYLKDGADQLERETAAIAINYDQQHFVLDATSILDLTSRIYLLAGNTYRTYDDLTVAARGVKESAINLGSMLTDAIDSSNAHYRNEDSEDSRTVSNLNQKLSDVVEHSDEISEDMERALETLDMGKKYSGHVKQIATQLNATANMFREAHDPADGQRIKESLINAIAAFKAALNADNVNEAASAAREEAGV